MDNDFYEKNLNTTRFSNILTNKESVKEFGELDFHAMIDFKKAIVFLVWFDYDIYK